MNFRFFKVLVVIVGISVSFALNEYASFSNPNPSIEALLNNQNQEEAKKIAENILMNGKKYTWDEYSKYGEELFNNGFVRKSPVDGRKSNRISKYEDYTCVKCHNITKEDPILTLQNPDRRYDMSLTNNTIKLTQGTTLWGAVNRISFYNGSYVDYRTLKVPIGDIDNPKNIDCTKEPEKCKEFDYTSLEEAIQMCSLYCSDGNGFLDKWELYSIIAFLWKNEVKITDLDFTGETRKEILDVLQNRQNHTSYEIKIQENKVLEKMLLSSSATRRESPKFTRINKWVSFIEEEAYPSFSFKSMVLDSNNLKGKKLFEMACSHCHYEGSSVSNDLAEDLGFDEERFYEVLLKGTKPRRRQPYMPEFPLERLSLDQAHEILAYLKTLQ